ncbi:MAG TPA: hypothetical protein VN690_00585 [Terriglobales bacterium]|nr:hypothetical protein [Terriglobales bacterium]
MRTWVLPALAVGAVIFLMTRPGRELQEQIGDNIGDWVDTVVRSNRRLQATLSQVQTVLDRCARTLQEAAS